MSKQAITVYETDGFNMNMPYCGFKTIKRSVNTPDGLIGSAIIEGVDHVVELRSETGEWEVA